MGNDELIINSIVKNILLKLKESNPLEISKEEAWYEINRLCLALNREEQKENNGEE